MEIIEKYGIILRRITPEDLEQVRDWRNSDYIRSQMIFTDYITEQMQIKWFETVNNDQNYYFIAKYKNDDVGVIHIKNIINNIGEGGIYLTNSKFENTDIFTRMVLCFNDYIFNVLKIDIMYSHVKCNNPKALSTSKAQGCVENKEKSTTEVVYFELNKVNYDKKTIRFKKILS
jgi:UDP-4-amino-4,6-dideoxy-N-acetyl-beta-L-altrosamine N-acetyltransferase